VAKADMNDNLQLTACSALAELGVKAIAEHFDGWPFLGVG